MPNQVLSWTNVLKDFPFTLALLRYAYTIDTGAAGEPEDVVLTDHVLQGLGVLWAVPVVLGLLG